MRLPRAESPVPRVARTLVAVLAAGVLSPLVLYRLGAQESLPTAGAPPFEARIWLDRGVDPVFAPGDRARVYYRSSTDAHLLVLHIDTDGVLRVIGDGVARGGRDYRLLFADSDEWEVEDSPGVGYFFALAAAEPFVLDRLPDAGEAGAQGWASAGRRIRSDPYVAVDDLRRALLPGVGDAYAIDFTTYHVGQSYSYPRFLCFQCHTERPFEEWNPYHRTCMDVRVVIYNDPYYYPGTRYRGDQAMYARPPDPGLPQYAFARRIPGEPGTPIVRSRTPVSAGVRLPPPGAAGQDQLPVRGDAGLGIVPGRLIPSSDAAPRGLPALPDSPANSNRPTLRRR